MSRYIWATWWLIFFFKKKKILTNFAWKKRSIWVCIRRPEYKPRLHHFGTLYTLVVLWQKEKGRQWPCLIQLWGAMAFIFDRTNIWNTFRNWLMIPNWRIDDAYRYLAKTSALSRSRRLIHLNLANIERLFLVVIFLNKNIVIELKKNKRK